jgi:hypothetical protein
MFQTNGLFHYRECLLVEGLGFYVLALALVENSQVRKACGHVGVLWAKDFFPDLQRALKNRFSLGVLALGSLEPSQAIEACGHVRVFWAQRLFHQRQRALVEGSALAYSALAW